MSGGEAAAELPLVSFPDAQAFEAWLAEQPRDARGAWLRFAKAGATEPTISKSDAIDSALSYGWVDGQLGRIDGESFKVRFTPRRPKSLWSEINRTRVAALETAGRMTPQGRAVVDAAKADGRWDAAYPSASKAEMPEDLAEALDDEPAARQLYDRLDAANRYAVLHRVHTAKGGERRAAKIAELVAMLARGETVHPLKGRR